MNKTGTHSLPNLFTNTKEACRDFYALTTNEYNDEMYHSKFEYKSKINEILNKIVIKNNFEPVVVNLGPLKGKWIPELYEIFKPKKLICVDLIDNFFEDLKKINPSIECFLTSGNELCCLETNTVDYIFSIDALTRIQEKDLISYLKDFKRVLKPGGKIFVHFTDDITHPVLRPNEIPRNNIIHACKEIQLDILEFNNTLRAGIVMLAQNTP